MQHGGSCLAQLRCSGEGHVTERVQCWLLWLAYQSVSRCRECGRPPASQPVSTGAPEQMLKSARPLLWSPAAGLMAASVLCCAECAVGMEGFWGVLLSCAVLPLLGSVRGPDGLPLDSLGEAVQVGGWAGGHAYGLGKHAGCILARGQQERGLQENCCGQCLGRGQAIASCEYCTALLAAEDRRQLKGASKKGALLVLCPAPSPGWSCSVPFIASMSNPDCQLPSQHLRSAAWACSKSAPAGRCNGPQPSPLPPLASSTSSASRGMVWD